MMAKVRKKFELLFLIITSLALSVSGDWSKWWNYDGISGPGYWGIMNPAWSICTLGKVQSPINIDPLDLQYDRTLDHVRINKQGVSGLLENTGILLKYTVNEGLAPVNISGGPLAYKYQFQEMYFRFGEPGEYGSEHTINDKKFPIEIQLFGFNSDLYNNMSEAREMPRGLVCVSVFVRLAESIYRKSNFEEFSKYLDRVRYKEDSVKIPNFSLHQFIPDTEDYITYEGSSTQPGCWETVTWILFNRPAYITKQQLELFYRLRKGESNYDNGPLGGKIRPQQPRNNRMLRTNIALDAMTDEDPECIEGIDSVEYLPNIDPEEEMRPYSPFLSLS